MALPAPSYPPCHPCRRMFPSRSISDTSCLSSLSPSSRIRIRLQPWTERRRSRATQLQLRKRNTRRRSWRRTSSRAPWRRQRLSGACAFTSLRRSCPSTHFFRLDSKRTNGCWTKGSWAVPIEARCTFRDLGYEVCPRLPGQRPCLYLFVAMFCLLPSKFNQAGSEVLIVPDLMASREQRPAFRTEPRQFWPLSLRPEVSRPGSELWSGLQDIAGGPWASEVGPFEIRMLRELVSLASSLAFGISLKHCIAFVL